MEVLENIIFKVFLIGSRMAGVLLFCWPFEKRKGFWLRLAAAVAVQIAMDSLHSVINVDHNIWFASLIDLGMFCVSSLMMWLCFEKNYFSILFSCIAGRSVSYIAGYIGSMLYAPFGSPNTYVSILIHTVVYVLFYFVFVRRIKDEEFSNLNNKKTILFALIVLIVTIFITNVFALLEAELYVKLIVYGLIILVCITTICLQFGQLAESKIKHETEIIQSLREKEKEQYEISHDTIKLIGIKHHDIKNMLELHRGKFSDEEIEAINHSMDAYDISFKTGNRTLDIVLTEKFIVCKNKNIRLECLVNGEDLNFMSEMDIYSLFLNALNNAIESAEKLADEAKRVIWIKTYKNGNIFCLSVKNYIAEEIKISPNKLIPTTKADKSYHGFGLQSIKMIAEKYGGTMSVKAEDKMFSLGLAIPLP